MGSQGGKLLLDHASANEAVARQANVQSQREQILAKRRSFRNWLGTVNTKLSANSDPLIFADQRA